MKDDKAKSATPDYVFLKIALIENSNNEDTTKGHNHTTIWGNKSMKLTGYEILHCDARLWVPI